jgi:nucleoside-diphosphate-sugar epimerase
MGTNDFVNQLINLGNAPFAPNWIVDVRDVARGHVLALPFPASVGNRRFIFNGATYLWSKAAAHLKEVKPEVKDKIPAPPGVLNLDTTKAKEVMGFGEYVATKKFEDALDDLLALEKLWAKAA